MYRFFPNNYMWSQAVLRILSTGGAVGEVARVVAALQPAADDYDYEAWYLAWHELGEHLWRQAELELSADHPRSARESFLRASSYYQWAISFMLHSDSRREACHQRSLDAFGRFAAFSEPPIERVEIPFEGTTLPAWFVPGWEGAGWSSPPATGTQARATVGQRKPTVYFMPGLESTKEQGIAFGQALAQRGFNTLLVDGPGVGEALLARGLINRHDEEVAGSATVDYLVARPDVDPERIAVVGLSLGGYRAPRVAAFETRLAGCVAWGAQWDYLATWERRRASERGAAPVPHTHMLTVFGARDLDEVSERLKPWRLSGVAERIRCPMLVTHGELDAQTPVENAYALYEGCGSPQKELKVFTQEEGGSAHCQNDNRLLAHAYIADWLEDVLVRGRRRQGIIVGWERKA
jgi:fermentation-respiration switch protein FrsA (DUF1100 family)